jgi:inosine-uridine nucleoside N-ribohydrolase
MLTNYQHLSNMTRWLSNVQARTSQSMKVVLDMDPGIDDALTLLLALNDPMVHVLAITTVSGNVNVSKATLNALRIIEASGKYRPPVYRGATRPMHKRRHPIHVESVHGTDGLGNSNLPEKQLASPEKTKAVDKLLELISTHKRKELSIVATGPLTNIAMLLQKEPSVANKLNKIFVMGGIYDNGLTRGNVTKYAEFNFYSDPEAAQIVMRSARKNNRLTVVASGLDVAGSPECAVEKNALELICSIRSRISDIACRILRYPIQTFSYFNLYDVFALFSLVHPEIFKMVRHSVKVCSRLEKFRGRCIVAHGNEGNVLVCKRVDHTKFNEMLFDGLK